MKKIIITVVLLLLAGVTFSQPIDTARFQLEFAPKLQNFYKITKPAIIPEETLEQVKFEYDIIPQSIDLNFLPSQIKPVKLQGEVMKKLYRNYLKVGFGYPLTPLGELCVHNFDNSKFSYGLNANHFSGWAMPIGNTMKNYAYSPFSDTRVHLFLNTFFKNQTLYSSLDYNHKVAHYYGFSRKLGFDSLYYEKSYRDTLKNNYHHLHAEIGLRSNYVQEDAKLKQDVRLNYDFLYTYRKEMENQIGLSSFFAYDILFNKLNGFLHPQIDFNLEYYINHWHNEKEVVQTTLNSYKIEFLPTVKFAVKEYHILVGFGIPIINNINSKMKGSTKCPIYPVAGIQLGILPGILSIYAGVDGNVKFNSLKDLLNENPFIKQGLDSLRFTKTQLSVTGGVKGNLVKKMNYHFSVRYSQTKDQAFFFIDTASLLKNKFDVVYSNVNLLNVCANLNWQVVNKLYLNLEANYWGYFNLKSVKKPWYKPAWEVAFSGKYYLKEKFIFDINMKLGFESYAYVPYLDLGKIAYSIEKISPLLNFGAGFEYLVTKRFSCFAMVNNIGFQHFSKYFDFKNIGFNAIIGVTYSFGDENLRKGKR
ncbi:MAG: hypothetical protein LBU83_05630 [Bacteroidales bacterium]|jgi:hypothetical protein|nr:hypothetical protein [Bacteroidales bacterium]